MMGQRQGLINIHSNAAQYMDGQQEARIREPADVQKEKGENSWTFEIINYALDHFIFFYLLKKS